MDILFDENTHTYMVDGEIAYISVTELLHKHGLAPDYSGVKQSVLDEKAEQGKEIHNDLENVLNEAGYEPKTEYGKKFQQWCLDNHFFGVGEQKIALKLNDVMYVSGTADVIGFYNDTGVAVCADHKSTSAVNKEYVSWQTSLLDYMFRKNVEDINGKRICWKGAKKFICFHHHDDEMKVVELEKIEDSEIERLLECEMKGEIYQRKSLVISEELKKQVEQIEHEFTLAENYYKAVKARVDDMRQKLLQEMEKQHIISYETDKFKVTYVAPYDKTSVDSTKLRKSYPTVYGECTKISKVKSSIRVTQKKNDGDEF